MTTRTQARACLHVQNMERVYRRACKACTATKRRCTKEIPSCLRCTTKGLSCSYPATRRIESSSLETITGLQETIAPLDVDQDYLFLDVDFNSVESILPTSDLDIMPFEDPYVSNELIPASDKLWFVTNDSWHIGHLGPGHGLEYIGEESLEVYVATVQGWFRQWTTDNTCPLIHRQLYQKHMPRCIQDAFTALNSYLNKTPATQKVVLQIIEDRATDLIYSCATQDLVVLPLLEHLARVQALLTYKLIRLFDGDIRLRARAEAHELTLTSWDSLLWQRTTEEMTAGNLPSLSPYPPVPLTPWKAWCVVESIRRTCLTVRILQSVYATMRDGAAACPGGVVCTFGAGLWEAGNEREWRQRANGKRMFMQSLSVREWLGKEDPGSVDEFGHAVLLVTCGLERKENWTDNGSA
ncbi:RNA polymerase ii mediator complex component [Paraphaeosphaeria sporulosa]